MCIKLFQKTKLPHPEEPKGKPVTDIEPVRMKWLIDWCVPHDYWNYWMGIDIYLTANVSFANCSDTLICVNPEWANPGVLAHECSHRSYSFLDSAEKVSFGYELINQKVNSPMVRQLFAGNGYGLTSPVEAHAEIYRYLGERMPADLKRYYPKMF
jgi:hypothetical protein